MARVVSEPGTKIATRLAVARLPITMPARPWPPALKNSTCRVHSTARVLASWVSPERAAAWAARAITRAFAAYRADNAAGVNPGSAARLLAVPSVAVPGDPGALVAAAPKIVAATAAATSPSVSS